MIHTPTRTATSGQRQMADRNYWLAEINSRNKAVTAEIETLRNETLQIEKDNEIYAQLERKFETLANEVRTMEGQFADLQLTVQDVSLRKRSKQDKDRGNEEYAKETSYSCFRKDPTNGSERNVAGA